MGGEYLQEAALHDSWRSADESRASIKSGDGARYRVLYSGIPGGSYGPDFKSAVMEAPDGSEMVGDVEIHIAPRDWYAHAHHRDARYNNVVLHAVGEISDAMPTFNSIGIEVPQAEIEIVRGVSGDEDLRLSPRDGVAREWADEAGDEWFGMKVRMFLLEISRYGADLALQMAVFECLGYPRNRTQFRRLAQRLPWPYLIRFCRRPRVSPKSLSSNHGPISELVAWAAGFTPRPRWTDVPRLPGEAPDWVMAAGRPANHPRTRVDAASFLIDEWLRCGGPIMHAVQAVRRSSRGSEIDHNFRGADANLGADRSGEIVVNATLPLVAALSVSRRNCEMYRKAHQLFATHPGLHRNSVLREAERMLRQRGTLVNRTRGARAQMGVMHAYRQMLLRPRPGRQIELGHLVPSV